MYTINHNKKQNVIEVYNDEKTCFGKIHLKQGASLQELTLCKIPIIQDLHPLLYSTTYASSILFPFANRVREGKYSFNGISYQLDTNQKEEKNALHGLVYNKTFEIIESKANENQAKIVLRYNEKSKSIGFPFTYFINVTYIFSGIGLNLSLKITNTSNRTFPFTIGWHPYFISDDLFKSNLELNSDKKLIIDERNITIGIENIKTDKNFVIENKQLDDCWILNSDKVIFNTPSYKLYFSSSAKENFLQAYTPPFKNAIAIEPTTGVSDSFNNKIGLQTLAPNKSYAITWNLKIEKNN